MSEEDYGDFCVEEDMYVDMPPNRVEEWTMLKWGKSARIWFNPFYCRNFGDFWDTINISSMSYSFFNNLGIYDGYACSNSCKIYFSNIYFNSFKE
jgi:hypothetical protein